MRSEARPESWLKVLPEGLYCEPGGFFIDPLRPVDRAVTFADPRLAALGTRSIGAHAEMPANLPGPRAYHEQRLALGVPEGGDFGFEKIFALDAGLDELNDALRRFHAFGGGGHQGHADAAGPAPACPAAWTCCPRDVRAWAPA